jgi:calcineurin-like phosphoesterase family protein
VSALLEVPEVAQLLGNPLGCIPVSHLRRLEVDDVPLVAVHVPDHPVRHESTLEPRGRMVMPACGAVGRLHVSFLRKTRGSPVLVSLNLNLRMISMSTTLFDLELGTGHVAGHRATDRLAGINDVLGSNHADVIRGDDSQNFLYGNGVLEGYVDPDCRHATSDLGGLLAAIAVD